MTEAEWLACPHSEAMLKFMNNSASTRKLRLLAVAACRRVWGSLGKAGRNGVEAIETYPEGVADEQNYDALRRQVGVEITSRVLARAGGKLICASTAVLRSFLSDNVEIHTPLLEYLASALDFAAAAYGIGDANLPDNEEQQAQTALVRDIFGNPFRPVAFTASWQTGTVQTLARQMYDSRDFSAMPILADALQDAGCENEDILNHCRGAGPHVRGCWVVDALLGKA